MEEKKKGGFSKLLKKGAFAVVCIVIAVLLLVAAAYFTLRVRRSCARSGVSPEATPTTTPAPTPLPDRVYSADRKPETAPPVELLDLSDGTSEETLELLTDREYWIDLTPENADGFRVIRNWRVGCSYLVENGEYYRLGEGEGGKGVVDVIVTDLDFDDEPDLLYTYHYGANEYVFSKVGWFNFATHTSVFSDFSQLDGFLSLVEEDGNCILYRAVRNADVETGTFGLTLTERLGEITEAMGRIVLIMDAPAETPEAE